MEASLALSRQLLARASSLQESQPYVSLLLNVEALKKAPATAREEARFALIGRLTWPLTGHTGWVTAVDVSPDAKLLAGADYDNTVRLWDVASRKPLGQPLKGHTDTVNAVALSPDGQLLASANADGTVRLWDVESGEPYGAPLKGHTDAVYDVAFSPDGQLLASAGYDRTAHQWDVASGKPLGQPLTGHTGELYDVAFTPDGRFVASSSVDRTVRLWNLEFKALIAAACRIANRDLSEDEWSRFVGPEFDYVRTCSTLPAG
jgi:WD40 repeat protein